MEHEQAASGKATTKIGAHVRIRAGQQAHLVGPPSSLSTTTIDPRTTMNSPPEPASPVSTQSSGSPPPEEVNYQPSQGAGYLSSVAGHISAAFGGSASSKRRLPTGAYGATGSSRDPKSRKKTLDGSRSGGGPSSSQYDHRDSAMKKEKDELIDTNTVEWLRKEVGDPFQEPGIKF